MKILHLLQSNRFSGAENVVCQIIGMFKDDTEHEFVYCSRDGQIREALDERGIAFAPMKDLTVSEVKRVIKEQKPDIIHAHDMRASFVAALACGKIKLVSHIHNNAFDSRGISVKSIAYLIAGIKASHIFWVSQSAFEGYAFHILFKKKSSVLYNIISIDALKKKMQMDTNSYDYDAVFLGRLSYPKNPQRLIGVFEKLALMKPDVKTAIIGTGELESEIKQLVREKKLEANVEFLGFNSNPYKILHDSKLMIMTSRWEGTPMCALEAMALGVPIVSTPTDGLKELVVNGETGYLCETDDELAEACYRLITDQICRKKMSAEMLSSAEANNAVESYKNNILLSYGRR